MEEIFPSYLSKDGLLRYLRVLLNLLFLKEEAMFFASHSFIICFADFRWKAATNQAIKHSCNFKAEMRHEQSMNICGRVEALPTTHRLIRELAALL